jgi:hypothetical protein
MDNVQKRNIYSSQLQHTALGGVRVLFVTSNVTLEITLVDGSS